MNWLKNLTSAVLPVWLMPLIIAVALASLTFFIFHKGELHERAKWVNKENAELVAKQEKILHLTTINRALERQAVIDATALKQDFERKLQDEKTHANTVLASVRAGTKRLYVTTKAVPACSGGVSLSAAVGREGDAETRTELSEETSGSLIKLLDESDEVVIESNYVKDQLTQCHAHVEALRNQSIENKPSNLTTTLQLSNSLIKENQQ